MTAAVARVDITLSNETKALIRDMIREELDAEQVRRSGLTGRDAAALAEAIRKDRRVGQHHG